MLDAQAVLLAHMERVERIDDGYTRDLTLTDSEREWFRGIKRAPMARRPK